MFLKKKHIAQFDSPYRTKIIIRVSFSLILISKKTKYNTLFHKSFLSSTTSWKAKKKEPVIYYKKSIESKDHLNLN